MKRSSRALWGGWLMVFGTCCPGLVAPAFGADQEFLVTWSGGVFANDANASAIITIDDTVLLNPGLNYSNVDPFVVDFVMTVLGADSGNGIFGLAAFDYINLRTGAGEPGDLPLDFGMELVGQATGTDPWGTSYAGDAGDFNPFNVGGDP